MKSIFIKKLDIFLKRYYEIRDHLSNISVEYDKKKYIILSKEFSSLSNLCNLYLEYKNLNKEILKLNSLLNPNDVDIKLLIEEEIYTLNKTKKKISKKMLSLLELKHKSNTKNIYLEIRAATGGKEAALFVSNLLNMYICYSDFKGWSSEVISITHCNSKGLRDVIIRLGGDDVYFRMKHESGIHRVQRVPKTECQGRVHTSTCSVAVLPELGKIDSVNINYNDLRIDTYRSSGAGGQHVNRTDSAVRITHIPTGIVCECQAERSQHKNKSKAMTLLYSKLLHKMKNDNKLDLDIKRRNLIGTGIRPEKIRTYNYNQNRVTDHRINISIHKLDSILGGELDILLEYLVKLL